MCPGGHGDTGNRHGDMAGRVWGLGNGHRDRGDWDRDVSRRTQGHGEWTWGHRWEGVGTWRMQGHGGVTWESTGTQWDQRGDVAGRIQGHNRGHRDVAGRPW